MACVCSMMLSQGSEGLKAGGQLDKRELKTVSSYAQGLVPKQEEPEVSDCPCNRQPFSGLAPLPPGNFRKVSHQVSLGDRRFPTVGVLVHKTKDLTQYVQSLEVTQNSSHCLLLVYKQVTVLPPFQRRVTEFYLLMGEQQDPTRADQKGTMFVAIFRKYNLPQHVHH